MDRNKFKHNTHTVGGGGGGDVVRGGNAGRLPRSHAHQGPRRHTSPTHPEIERLILPFINQFSLYVIKEAFSIKRHYLGKSVLAQLFSNQNACKIYL